jgi:hypothetical protein
MSKDALEQRAHRHFINWTCSNLPFASTRFWAATVNS